MVSFAAKLRKLREESGMSQEALARAADMSVGTVRDYEQGRREPSLKYALRLARALGVSCTEFEGLDDDQAEDQPRRKK